MWNCQPLQDETDLMQKKYNEEHHGSLDLPYSKEISLEETNNLSLDYEFPSVISSSGISEFRFHGDGKASNSTVSENIDFEKTSKGDISLSSFEDDNTSDHVGLCDVVSPLEVTNKEATDAVEQCGSDVLGMEQRDTAEAADEPESQSSASVQSTAESKQRKGTFRCDICDEAFSFSVHLKVHRRVHAGEKPFEHSECEKAFEQKGALMHSGQKPFKCPICEQTFRCRSSVYPHLELHSETLFTCDVCNKVFKQKRALRAHMQLHSSDKRPTCKECGQEFTRRHSLTKHMRSHTGERPYKCVRCDKAFAHKHYLVVHERIHTGDKPFLCSRCGKAYSDRGNLAKHIQTHMTNKPFQCSQCSKVFVDKRGLTCHLHLHMGTFVCGECGRAFVDRSKLDRHIMCYHTADRPFTCPECRRQFTRSHHLSHHRLRLHGVALAT